MSRSHPSLIVDARPAGPTGPLAAAPILGRPVIAHLIELAGEMGPEPVLVHVRPEDREELRSLLPADGCELRSDPPPGDVPSLRADRLYDGRRLRRALRRGADPESAAIWRLDSAAGLAGAPDELLRRRTFQPLGRYWALGPARWLARRLRPTRVRPNALTLASGMLMLVAAGLIGFGPFGLAASLAMALALVLDTADGHLARLQGTASDFGRWLDSSLDELGDMALHAAVAWSLYQRDQTPGWLVLGMLYGMGKYLFFVGNATWDLATAERPLTPAFPYKGGGGRMGLRRLAHGIGHADVRWHAWIVLAALGRLDVELITFAAYFPLRALAGAIRKVGRHA